MLFGFTNILILPSSFSITDFLPFTSVSVVSFTNKGHLPIWDQQLTRLEMDPMAHGTALAKAVRTYLHGKPFPAGIVLGTVWKSGDTF